jgi:hypothetical protein
VFSQYRSVQKIANFKIFDSVFESASPEMAAYATKINLMHPEAYSERAISCMNKRRLNIVRIDERLSPLEKSRFVLYMQRT